MENKCELPERRFPDFIIAGAMKCGTTSLHYILDSHPDIFIPGGEIHFFNIDDHIQSPDFFVYDGKKWYYPHFEEKVDEYLDWYESFFKNSGENQLLGEDSTAYLSSEIAPKRIARFNPKAKIIVMLRDPASRTYSHYWHLLRTGRAVWNFEDSLQVSPSNLIQRSLYKEQIEHFFRILPNTDFHFILFEEFIQDRQAVLEGVCQFLGVSADRLSPKAINTRFNPALIPRSIRLQIWRNRLLRLRANYGYTNHILEVPGRKSISTGVFSRIFDGLHSIVNPQKQTKPPKMKPETREFLNYYFAKANQGLSDLIGKDVDAYWGK